MEEQRNSGLLTSWSTAGRQRECVRLLDYSFVSQIFDLSDAYEKHAGI